jgi:hypothetical protein
LERKRTAGANSLRQYERGAEQLINACAQHVGPGWVGAGAEKKVAWFLSYLESYDILCKGSVSMYRQCAKVACQRLLSEGVVEPIEFDLTTAIDTAGDILNKKIGHPLPPRGASRKVKDPLLVELGDIFAHQRAKFLDGRDRLDLILALYIIVMPRIGLRPVELTWARWDGNNLYARTAKRAGRPERRVPHEHWPPVYKAALGLLVALMPRELSDAEFETWRNRLASRLARASKRSRKKRRLSLYFARHIAMATWKQAGITPELIAKLAGHAGLQSQHHYASGRAGYRARYVFLDPADAEAVLSTVPNAAEADIPEAPTADQYPETPTGGRNPETPTGDRNPETPTRDQNSETPESAVEDRAADDPWEPAAEDRAASNTPAPAAEDQTADDAPIDQGGDTQVLIEDGVGNDSKDGRTSIAQPRSSAEAGARYWEEHKRKMNAEWDRPIIRARRNNDNKQTEEDQHTRHRRNQLIPDQDHEVGEGSTPRRK